MGRSITPAGITGGVGENCQHILIHPGIHPTTLIDAYASTVTFSYLLYPSKQRGLASETIQVVIKSETIQVKIIAMINSEDAFVSGRIYLGIVDSFWRGI
jgi:hypothetical protein